MATAVDNDIAIMTEQKANITNESCGMPEIHEHESQRKYKLIDRENNEMERTAGELFQANCLLTNRDLWVGNFSATVKRVWEWCQERRDRLSLALVDLRSRKIAFYFVPVSSSYDMELGNAMTDLEVEIRGSSGIGRVETFQIPAGSLDRFVGPNALAVWDSKAIEQSAK